MLLLLLKEKDFKDLLRGLESKFLIEKTTYIGEDGYPEDVTKVEIKTLGCGHYVDRPG